MIDVSTSGHYVGDCRDLLAQLPDACVQMCVTSPPYWGLRDYGHAGQLGLETTPDEYVASIIDVFRGVRRVLRDDGTLWLNLGDSYAGATATGNPGAQGAAGVMADRSVIAARRARPGNPDKNGGVSNRNGLGAVAGLKPKAICK